MQASGQMLDPEMLREKYGIDMVPVATVAPALPPPAMTATTPKKKRTMKRRTNMTSEFA